MPLVREVCHDTGNEKIDPPTVEDGQGIFFICLKLSFFVYNGDRQWLVAHFFISALAQYFINKRRYALLLR